MGDHGEPSADRAARVRAVLDDCVRRRESGEVVADPAVIAAHPELMPELGEALRALAIVGAAFARRDDAPASAADAKRVEATRSLIAGSERGAAAPEPDEPAPDALSVRWDAECGPPGPCRTVPRRLGSVRLLEEIGRGGMGVVFRGWDEMLGRAVAVKFLLAAKPDQSDPHFEQFLKGARAEAALRHPHIVAVHTAGVLEDLPYLVMDYVDGPTLQEVSRKAGSMATPAAVKVIVEVAAAAAVLHEHGIIHRDLKPGNVLFDREGGIYVTDFGLALPRPQGAGGLMLAGTPAYMAPECFAGKASFQTDVYALGIMLYELQAGQLPFTGDILQIRRLHEEQPLPLADLTRRVPAEIVEVIERATHKNEVFRYKSAGHFQRALLDRIGQDTLRQGATELASLVIRTMAEPVAAPPTTPGGEKPSSTYSELLSERAARKRDEQMGRPPVASLPTPADTVTLDPPAAVASGVACDIACVKCGYNLRGLNQERRCPECGMPVARSLHADRLATADPSWLERICRGQACITVGVALMLAVYSSVFVVALTGRLPRFVAKALDVGLLMVPLILVLIGVVKVTALDPRLSLARQPLGLRRLSRGAAIAALLCTLLGAAVDLQPSGVPPAVGKASNWAYGIMLAFTVVSVTRYLARLAERVPDPKLVQRTRSTVYRFTACVVGYAVIKEFVGLHPVSITDAMQGPGRILGLAKMLGTCVLGALAIGSFVYTLSLARVWFAYRKVLNRCLLESRRLTAA